MLGFTQPTNYNIGMCEVQILPINNQYKVRNIKFQGQVIKNPVLDNCLEHFSPKQYKEYQNLISMANKVVDEKKLETYERMTIVQDKHRMVYKSYIGIRDKNNYQNFGEELVKTSSKNGSTIIFYGYVDAILKPLRNLYNKGKIIESVYFNK